MKLRRILLSWILLSSLAVSAQAQVTITPSRSISAGGGGGGTGDVVGPSGATDSNFACFDSTTGKLVKDCLVSEGSFLSSSTGSVQDGHFGDLYLRDDTNSSHYLVLTDAEDLTANRILSISVGNAARSLSLSGNLVVSSAATVSGTNTGDVSLAGTPAFITIAGQVITRVAIVNTDISSSAAIALSKLATQANNTVVANTSGSTAVPTAVNVNALLDAVGSTQGSIYYRNSTQLAALVPSTDGYVLTTHSTGANPTWSPVSATAGGSNTHVQFNDSGSIGGDSGFTYNKTTDTATVVNLGVTGLSCTPTAKVANYTVTTGDCIVKGTPSGADITFTLPTAVGASGRLYFFNNAGTADDVILDGNAAETINGAATHHIIPGESAVIYSDNANWFVLATTGFGLTTPATESVPSYDPATHTWNWNDLAALGGGGGAPTTAHYLTSQAESGLSAEVNLGALTTGLLKITVSGSVATPSTATSGTDYAPATSGSGILKGNGSGGFSTATAGTDYVSPSSTETLTNKIFDTEGTGNTFTETTLFEWTAGVVQASTASAGCSLPAANFPSPGDGTGSNTIYATLDFDDTTNESIQCRFWLPSGATEGGSWTGAVDAEFIWKGANTTNEVCWCVSNAAAGDGATGDPSLSNTNCVNDTAKGTANQFNTAIITNITTTGWGDGKIVFLKILRNADHSDISSITEDDDFVGDAKLISFRLVLRIAK